MLNHIVFVSMLMAVALVNNLTVCSDLKNMDNEKNGLHSASAESFDEYDPSSAEIERILSAELYKCARYNKYVDCLQQLSKKVNAVYGQPQETDQYVAPKKRSGGEWKKRNEDELFSFFKHAMAKNIKLKSNIKTTRF